MIHIALYEPEFPGNTGNLIRLSANAGFQLHLIEPLGFIWDDKKLQRAKLDYEEYAKVKIHKDYDSFLQAIAGQRLFALSTKGKKVYSDVQYQAGDCLMFGPETRGLPPFIREHESVSELLTIPMTANSRSINLSNSAAIVAFEAWRQIGFQL